jgi:AP-4 complex subunit sigma-1
MIQFVLLVNKQGQTRLAKYTDQAMTVEEKRALEGEIVRKCLARSEKQARLGNLLVSVRIALPFFLKVL